MNRRLFMRAAPAAVALAPSLANPSSPSTENAKNAARFYDGVKQGGAEPIYNREWIAERRASLQAIIDGKDDGTIVAMTRDNWAAAIDALQSVSTVNKHRMIRERERRAEIESRKWWARQELADLLKQAVGLK